MDEPMDTIDDECPHGNDPQECDICIAANDPRLDTDLSDQPNIGDVQSPAADKLRAAIYGPTKGEHRLAVDVGEGKYKVIQDASGRLFAMRHGLVWRDCVGDGLILALASDLQSARARVAELEASLKAKPIEVTAATLTVEHAGELNLNDFVWVKLTDIGRALCRIDFDLHKALFQRLNVEYKPKDEIDGWSKWQLHELIEVLGDAIGVGYTLPFETTISLVDPSKARKA